MGISWQAGWNHTTGPPRPGRRAWKPWSSGPLSGGAFTSLPFPFDSHGSLSSPGTCQREELLCAREAVPSTMLKEVRTPGRWAMVATSSPDKNRNCIFTEGRPQTRAEPSSYSSFFSLIFHLFLRFFFHSISLSPFFTVLVFNLVFEHSFSSPNTFRSLVCGLYSSRISRDIADDFGFKVNPIILRTTALGEILNSMAEIKFPNGIKNLFADLPKPYIYLVS